MSFPKLVHDQQRNLLKRQASEERLRQFLSLLLGLDQALGARRPHHGDLMFLIFDHAQRGDDLAALQHAVSHAADHGLIAVPPGRQVHRLGSVLLPHSDRHYLQPAAFDPSMEAGVRLDAVEDQDAVRLVRIAVHINRKALPSLSSKTVFIEE